jgi:4'-phosphopantetheinyl transferase EntD
MKAIPPSTDQTASLESFFRNINLDAEPLLNATEAAPILKQVLAKGEVTIVRSPLDNRKLGHVVTFADWAVFVASEFVPAGVGLRVTEDLHIQAYRKSIRQFTAVLIRKGQERPTYSGDDFRFSRFS